MRNKRMLYVNLTLLDRLIENNCVCLDFCESVCGNISFFRQTSNGNTATIISFPESLTDIYHYQKPNTFSTEKLTVAGESTWL